MTARALQFDSEKRRGDDVALGGKRRVIIRRESEARAATFPVAAPQQHEFRGETIHRFSIAQRLVKKPAKRSAVVEGGLQDARVFRQHVLPIADPVVRPPLIGEEAVDDCGALVAGPIREKRPHLALGGRHAYRIEIHAPQKRRVTDDGGEGDALRRDRCGGPHGTGIDPCFQDRDLGRLECVAFRRHALILIRVLDSRDQLTGGGLAPHHSRQV